MPQLIKQSSSFIGTDEELFNKLKNFSKSVHSGDIEFRLDDSHYSNFSVATTIKLKDYLAKKIDLSEELLEREVANTMSKLYGYSLVPDPKKDICIYKNTHSLVVPFRSSVCVLI